MAPPVDVTVRLPEEPPNKAPAELPYEPDEPPNEAAPNEPPAAPAANEPKPAAPDEPYVVVDVTTEDWLDDEFSPLPQVKMSAAI